jgi:hypothetical protein
MEMEYRQLFPSKRHLVKYCMQTSFHKSLRYYKRNVTLIHFPYVLPSVLIYKPFTFSKAKTHTTSQYIHSFALVIVFHSLISSSPWTKTFLTTQLQPTTTHHHPILIPHLTPPMKQTLPARVWKKLPKPLKRFWRS